MTARQVAESGLGLDDITEILNAHVGVRAEALHTDPTNTSLLQFRQSIASAMSQADTYLIANFDRYEFMGEGGGHHSPLGAFCAESDTVLVLDVARYRSVTLHWHSACVSVVVKACRVLSAWYVFRRCRNDRSTPKAVDYRRTLQSCATYHLHYTAAVGMLLHIP